MDKITYLAELAEGLARWVPERERRDILRYYAEYFEEAGCEREAEVVAELGDPWALSCRLAVEGGYVTREKAASWRPGKTWPRILLGTAVGLSIFAVVSAVGLLAFNAMRTARGVVRDPVSVVGAEVLFENNFALVEGADNAMVFYLIDGESVAAFSSIDADISLGDIEVVSGDDYTLSVRRGESLLGYEPILEVRDGVLRLRDGELSRQSRVDSWDDLKSLFGVGQGAMEVTITVPEGAVLDKVSVKTRLGDVLLYGVCAESVTVETGLGDVECYEARNVRALNLSTGLGDVCMDMEEIWPGANIGLKSGMGSVEVNLGCSEKECAYKLESGLGAVIVNGSYQGSKAERKGGAMSCKLDAASGKGDVNVYFTLD